MVNPNKSSIVDWLLATLIALLIGGYPAFSFLSVIFGIDVEKSRFLTVPYRFVVLGLALSLFIYAWRNGQLRGAVRVHLPFLIFWILYFIRIGYESINPSEFRLKPNYYYWSYALGICFLTVLPLMQKMNIRVAILAPRITVALSFTACLSGLLLQQGGIDLNTRSSGSELLNPISFGQCAVTLILLCGYLAMYTRKKLKILMLITLSVPGFLVLAIAASRSPLLSLSASGLVLVIHGLFLRQRGKLLAGIVLVSSVLPPLAFYLMESGSALTARTSATILDIRQGGFVDRIMLWDLAVKQYFESPLIGKGLEISGVGYPHNLALESLMVLGLLGASVFLWLQVKQARESIGLVRANQYGWIPVLCTQYFILSLVSGSLYASSIYWGFIIIVAAASASIRKVKHRYK